MSFIEILTIVSLVLWILLSAGIILTIAMLVPGLRLVANSAGRIEQLVGDVNERSRPLLAHLEQAADNANYIAVAVRTDTEKVSQSLERATDSLTAIVEIAEERAIEISSFLEVVQEEAEETFFSTASLLRGLRASRLIAGRGKQRAKKRKRRTG